MLGNYDKAITKSKHGDFASDRQQQSSRASAWFRYWVTENSF
jgi:hypothetical protein